MSHRKRKNNNLVWQSAYDISPVTHTSRLESGHTEFLLGRSAVKNKSKTGKKDAWTFELYLDFSLPGFPNEGLEGHTSRGT